MASTNFFASRRPSLAKFYSNLQAQEDPFEELQNAALLFPMEEDDAHESHSLPSTSSSGSSTSSPRFDDSDSESDSSSDSDSVVELMDLNSDCYQDSIVIHNPPFRSLHEQTLQITGPLEDTPVGVAPSLSPSSLSSQLCPERSTARPSPVADDSDRDAEYESTGDASDDEYLPSAPLNRRKRARRSLASSRPLPFTPPSSPLSSRHTDAEPPTKRARATPVSRNMQTSLAEVQRAENSDEYSDFVCRVCGWVQRNKRVPDFKRHVKTHQRSWDDRANKGWCCMGVLLSEAADYPRIKPDAPVYLFTGQMRVGGCQKTFSRRDALKRHLENPNVKCVSPLGRASDE